MENFPRVGGAMNTTNAVNKEYKYVLLDGFIRKSVREEDTIVDRIPFKSLEVARAAALYIVAEFNELQREKGRAHDQLQEVDHNVWQTSIRPIRFIRISNK